MSDTIAIYLCATLLLVTAALHSVLGEMRLIGPLLRQRDGVLSSDLARFLIRAVWHIMTVCFAVFAAALIASAEAPSVARGYLLTGIAIGIGGAGLIDAIGSRGQHVGWPLLVLTGIFALLPLINGN